MPLRWFNCNRGKQVPIEDCLAGCPCECMTLPTRIAIAQEREWTGKPSTTQLLNGTMMNFLKITRDYVINPDDKAFSLHGTGHHSTLSQEADKLGFVNEFMVEDETNTGHFDLAEPDINNPGFVILEDYKTWGSYKIANLIVADKVGKGESAFYRYNILPNGEYDIHDFDLEMQMNDYRVKMEKMGVKVSKMRVQVTVRDGGIAMARSRGIKNNIYLLNVRKLPDEKVVEYFKNKAEELRQALATGSWLFPCSAQENWNDKRCLEYCEVWGDCPHGITVHMSNK